MFKNGIIVLGDTITWFGAIPSPIINRPLDIGGTIAYLMVSSQLGNVTL